MTILKSKKALALGAAIIAAGIVDQIAGTDLLSVVLAQVGPMLAAP